MCSGTLSQSTLFTGQGILESVIVGNSGKLYFSGSAVGSPASQLLRSSGPGVAPITVTDGPGGAGGLAWSGRNLLWGYGNTLANGSVGDLTPSAGLYSVDLSDGSKTTISDHLGMANGIARGADGSIYASNNLGLKLDRITRNGVTRNGWASLKSANGLAVGKNGRYLYANQMFETPSTIAKIDTKDPSKIYTYYTSPEPLNALFDGLTRDSQNNLYAAVFGRGEVWKITPDRQACVVATGLKQPTSIAISTAKKGYRAGNLYAVGFGGEVTQIKGAAAAEVPE